MLGGANNTTNSTSSSLPETGALPTSTAARNKTTKWVWYSAVATMLPPKDKSHSLKVLSSRRTSTITTTTTTSTTTSPSSPSPSRFCVRDLVHKTKDPLGVLSRAKWLLRKAFTTSLTSGNLLPRLLNDEIALSSVVDISTASALTSLAQSVIDFFDFQVSLVVVKDGRSTCTTTTSTSSSTSTNAKNIKNDNQEGGPREDAGSTPKMGGINAVVGNTGSGRTKTNINETSTSAATTTTSGREQKDQHEKVEEVEI